MAWVSKRELKRQIEELKNSSSRIIVRTTERKPNAYETEIRALKDYIAVTQGNKTIPYKNGYKEGFDIGLKLGERIGRKKASIIFGFSSVEDMRLGEEWDNYEGALVDVPDSIPPYGITIRYKEQK